MPVIPVNKVVDEKIIFEKWRAEEERQKFTEKIVNRYGTNVYIFYVLDNFGF
jgi:hypothetical protein